MEAYTHVQMTMLVSMAFAGGMLIGMVVMFLNRPSHRKTTSDEKALKRYRALIPEYIETFKGIAEIEEVLMNLHTACEGGSYDSAIFEGETEVKAHGPFSLRHRVAESLIAAEYNFGPPPANFAKLNLTVRLKRLLDHAYDCGYIITVDLIPLEPLAMGYHRMFGEVRKSHYKLHEEKEKMLRLHELAEQINSEGVAL